MARKATTKSGGAAKRSKSAAAKAAKPQRSQGRTGGGGGSRGRAGGQESLGAADAVVKLLQSPLVADLVAVAATAALAALAEHGFSSRGASDKRRAGRAVKEAGKAAAAAVGRRLGNEFEEIRKASKAKSGGAAKA